MGFAAELSVLATSIVAGAAAYLALRVAARRNFLLRYPKLGPRQVDRLFYALAGLYALVLAFLSISSFLAFSIDGYDLSIFDQVVWNSLHGHLFENTILPDAPFLLGQRFSPILLAFVPLYAIWSSPIVLMVTQTLGIAAAGLPVYWVARERLGHIAAVFVGLTFFLFPAVEYVNLFEFHEIALAIPLFSFGMFFLLRRRYIPFLVCLGVAMLVKEDMAFVSFMLGLYVLLVQRKRVLGIGLAVGSVIWSILLLQYILPFLHGDGFGAGYYYFGHGLAAGIGRYDYLGNGLAEIVRTLLTRPDIVLPHILIPAKIEFVLELVVPLALTPVLGIEIAAMALPTLVISILSDYAPQYSIEFHYTASLLPFLFFASILGLERIKRWDRTNRSAGPRFMAAMTAVVVAAALSYHQFAPGPLSQRFDSRRYSQDAHTALGHALLNIIPSSAAVIAQGDFQAHVSERQNAYGFPSLDYCHAEYLFADTTRYRYRLFEPEWDKWLATGHFDIARQDGYLIAKTVKPDRLLALGFGDGLRLVRFTLGAKTPLLGSMPFCPILEWATNNATGGQYKVLVQLLDERGHIFASDEHEITFPQSQGSTAGQTIQHQYNLSMSPTYPSGAYRLVASVYDSLSDRMLPASTPAQADDAGRAAISKVQLEKDKSSYTASQVKIEQPLYVDMGEIRLLGFAPVADRYAQGESVPVGVYWRARGVPRGDYDVRLELADAGGHVVADQDSRPVYGGYPTTAWSQGEVVLDWHDLILPRDIQTGTYALSVTLRDLSSSSTLGRAFVKSIQVSSSN